MNMTSHNRNPSAFRSPALLVALILLTSLPIRAHDFWIQPPTFQVELGEAFPLSILIGDHFKGEPFARQQKHIERFEAIGPSGTTQIPGLEGRHPAGFFRTDQPGVYQLVYRSHRSFTSLPANNFEAYLHEEGLEEISKLRKERGESENEGREAYSRCAKALLLVGEASEGGSDKATGLPLEIVALDKPFAASGSLHFQILFQDSPLANAQVVAYPQQDPSQRKVARSDPAGRLSFNLTPGVWLLKAVHMIEAPDEIDADWESFWASLIFEVPTASP